MKNSLIIMAVLLSTGAFASSSIEESIFRVLKSSGAYINYSYTTTYISGVIKLGNLGCNHIRGTDSFDCSYIDTARPHESTRISGDDAETLFDELVTSGVKTIYVFGMEIINVEHLRCKSQKMIRSEDSRFSCQRLKPLID